MLPIHRSRIEINRNSRWPLALITLLLTVAYFGGLYFWDNMPISSRGTTLYFLSR